MLITLTLLIALAQEPPTKPATLPPDHRVALVYSPTDIRFMRLDEAERTWQRLKRKNTDPRTFAALTQALGVRTEVPHVSQVRERLDWEIRRGVRRPVQELEKIKP